MAHKEWCGKSCAECEHPCPLDMSIPCSPDCQNLTDDGYPGSSECVECDAYKGMYE